jgi:hypothetical protein
LRKPGKADAGVTRGRLQNNGVRPDLACLFCRINHRDRDTILDAVRRIEKFQFGKDGGVNVLGYAIQLHQRGVADQFQDIFCDFHNSKFSLVYRISESGI